LLSQTNPITSKVNFGWRLKKVALAQDGWANTVYRNIAVWKYRFKSRSQFFFSRERRGFLRSFFIGKAKSLKNGVQGRGALTPTEQD